MKNKTNRIGIVALIVLGLIILGLSTSNFIKEKRKLAKDLSITEKILHEVTLSFHVNDKEKIMKWAQGIYLDAWDGPIVLISNNHLYGIEFLSYGPDKQFNTKDDISVNLPKKHIKRNFAKKKVPLKEKISKKINSWKFWE